MTKMRDLKVSIITPALVKDDAQLQWLHEAIASVVGQNRRDVFEMVIVNDGSPVNLDPLKETWAAATANQTIRWIDATHQGVSAARNQAAEEARAPLLLPLDADDKLAQTALASMLDMWDKRKADILYTDVVMFGQDYAQVYVAPEYHFKTLLKATFMTVGCLHKKTDWERVGGWRLDMTKGLEDWEYWIALGELGVCGQRVPEPLYYYRRHPRGRLQWLKANKEKWDSAYAAMRDLHIDSYNGRYPVGCCGGRAKARRPARPVHAAMPAPLAQAARQEKPSLVQVMYVGGRRGGFRLVAQPSRGAYHIPGAGRLVEQDKTGVQGVHPQDVAWFRSVAQGRDFKVVQPPAQAAPPPPPPKPAEAPTIKDSRAWTPQVMERPQKVVERPQAVVNESLVTVSITPAAQELAEEHGIDWGEIRGSGKDGNILVRDVRDAIG